MRASEFLAESDHANRSTNNLLNVLDTLRNRFGDVHEEPKIRVDSLINMVRATPGSEMFNIDSLMSAYDKNPAVKNLITGIYDDDSQIKHVYIKPAIGDYNDNLTINNPDTGTDSTARSNPASTVDAMSKRALNRRK
jgi:hypothetical protein